MKSLASKILDDLVRQARQSPRRRANLNLHDDLGDTVQRLAIAMEPDTIVFPHRHPQTFELLYPLRGRFIVLHFDDAGLVTQRAVLGEDCAMIETPASTWHAVQSLDSGGVIFEVKQGPYVAVSETDSASWASAFDAVATQGLLNWYRGVVVGERFSRATASIENRP